MTPYRVGVLALAMLCGLAAGCARDPQTAVREYVQSGDRYVTEGKLKAAIIEYRNALQHDPRNADVLFKLGETYASTGDAQKAYESYSRAADLAPDHIPAHLKSGAILLAAGQFEGAKTRAEEVLRRNRAHVPALLLLGNALAGLKQFDAALAQVEEAIQLDPAQSQPYSALGALRMARGERSEAEAAFRQAVSNDPRSIDARLALTNYYWSAGRIDAAEISLQDALALNPSGELVNRAAGAFYLSANRPADAERYFKTAADGPKAGDSRLALADYYVLANRASEALPILEPLAAQKDYATAAGTRIAAIQFGSGRSKEGHRTLDGVLAREPRAPRALLLKGRILLAERDLDGALKVLNAAVAADPGQASARYGLGLAQVELQRTSEARASFREVVKLNPLATGAYLQLARLELADGRPEEAVRLAEQARTSRPDDIRATILLATAYRMIGQTSRAATELSALAKRYPASAPLHAALGATHLDLKNGQAARQEFARALELDPALLDALSGLVALDMAAGQSADARGRVQRRLAVDPDNPGLLVLAGRTYAADRDFLRAETTLKRAIQVDPSNLDAYSTLGQVYVAQGKLNEARTEFEHLAERQPDSVAAHTMIGMILEAERQPDRAAARYTRALQIDPRAAVAANNLAWLRVEEGGDLNEALRLAHVAYQGLQTRPEVADTLGWIYCKTNRPVLAVPLLERSVASVPDRPTYQYHLGMAYLKAGQTAKARATLGRALALDGRFAGNVEARQALADLQ